MLTEDRVVKVHSFYKGTSPELRIAFELGSLKTSRLVKGGLLKIGLILEVRVIEARMCLEASVTEIRRTFEDRRLEVRYVQKTVTVERNVRKTGG